MEMLSEYLKSHSTKKKESRTLYGLQWREMIGLTGSLPLKDRFDFPGVNDGASIRHENARRFEAGHPVGG